MKLPIVVKRHVSKQLILSWKKRMKAVEGRTDRTRNWMLWSKRQNKGFPSIPDWENPSDVRRRLIQVVDKYDIVKDKKWDTYNFVVKKPYFWVSYLSPKNEISNYLKHISMLLTLGKWKKIKLSKYGGRYKNGDLIFSFKIFKKHREDLLSKRDFPNNYTNFEATISDGKTVIPEPYKSAPWKAVNSSFRKITKKGIPVLNPPISEISKFFPVQVQLGAGASVDSGIPPLHVYHDIYNVSDRSTGKTIFSLEGDDALSKYLRNPVKFWKEATLPYLSVFEAKPNVLHNVLFRLKEKGLVVGPIITSNYDGLPYLLGFKETFVRKLAASHRSEVQKFDPRAKALLVVGEHADRRFIQKSARKQGLKVIYIDPEGFYENNKFIPYIMESPTNDDIHYRMTAKSFGKILTKIANKWQK